MRSVSAGLSTNSGLPWWLSGKESTCSAEDTVSIPGLGRLLEKEMATYSRILVWEIPRTSVREAWLHPHGVTKELDTI